MCGPTPDAAFVRKYALMVISGSANAIRLTSSCNSMLRHQPPRLTCAALQLPGSTATARKLMSDRGQMRSPLPEAILIMTPAHFDLCRFRMPQLRTLLTSTCKLHISYVAQPRHANRRV
jgi:hypothetical protein